MAYLNASLNLNNLAIIKPASWYSEGKVFSCKHAPQQHSMSVCPSVYLSFCVCSKLKFLQRVQSVQFKNVPKCSRVHAECSRMFWNACRMFQNVVECRQNVPECSKMHAEGSIMFQNAYRMIKRARNVLYHLIMHENRV